MIVNLNHLKKNFTHKVSSTIDSSREGDGIGVLLLLLLTLASEKQINGTI